MSANPPIRPPDPIVTSRFRVDFGSKLSGAFTNVSLASSSVGQVDYKYVDNTGRPGYSTQPGLKGTGVTITLKRALTNDKSAWTWHQMVLNGKIDEARTPGTIFIVGPDGSTPLVSFHVENAWPTKVEFGSGLAAGTASPGEESITLACENFYRE